MIKLFLDIENLLYEGSYGRILLISVTMALLSGAFSAPLQEPSWQEALAYINSLQHSQEMMNNNKMRELQEALYRRGGEETEDEALLQAKLLEFLQAHEAKADKRASYMSLCHFKICNMGRKRTLWPKN